jgi:sulfate adenylyltransferase
MPVLRPLAQPRPQQGFCVWFTGLSGSGKSTTAEALATILEDHGRIVTLLDGDIIRTHLSKGLGFSREDRDANVSRIAFVASEIVRHGGAVLCAAISPYRSTRDDCRALVGADRFVEVFVDTPLEICISRDPKQLYARALKGEIKEFTGIDAPYEAPIDPQIVLDTVTHGVDQNAATILMYLADRRWVTPLRSVNGRVRGQPRR